jgi:hypothetical protein
LTSIGYGASIEIILMEALMVNSITLKTLNKKLVYEINTMLFEGIDNESLSDKRARIGNDLIDLINPASKNQIIILNDTKYKIREIIPGKWLIEPMDRIGTRKKIRNRQITDEKQTLSSKEISLRNLYSTRARQKTKETGVKYVCDHIIPVAKNGSEHPDNFQIITEEQNLLKGANIRDDIIGEVYHNGEWIIRDPAVYPGKYKVTTIDLLVQNC